MGLIVVKLWQLGEPTYNAFGVIALMYLGVLIAQERNSSVATRTAMTCASPSMPKACFSIS